ncbi:hypothetical protein OG21DRAFT_438616 [Imleria badia]|nr:hypothetical protein OG21DRAFT_438616 [Imleria badia]
MGRSARRCGNGACCSALYHTLTLTLITPRHQNSAVRRWLHRNEHYACFHGGNIQGLSSVLCHWPHRKEHCACQQGERHTWVIRCATWRSSASDCHSFSRYPRLSSCLWLESTMMRYPSWMTSSLRSPSELNLLCGSGIYVSPAWKLAYGDQ